MGAGEGFGDRMTHWLHQQDLLAEKQDTIETLLKDVRELEGIIQRAERCAMDEGAPSTGAILRKAWGR